MRIVLIGTTTSCVLGFRADLIKALVANGNQVFAYALDYTENGRDKVRALGAIPVDYTFSRTGLNPFSDLFHTFKLSFSFRKVAPDVVFSYFAKPVIFGTFAALLAGVKRRIGMLEGLGFVFTEHPHAIVTKTKVLRKIQVMLYRASFPFLERIIFLNPDDPIDLIEKHSIKANHVSVLGAIGLNLEDYVYSLPVFNPVTFLFIGRLLEEKGVHEFIAAAKFVKAKYPDVRFIMLGGLDEANPGSLSLNTLKQLVDGGLVEHPGHVENVVEWIAESSVFVLPSYREGVPRSTQEAMAIGRPVITNDVPGCRETVVDGVNGFLIPPWSHQILADKMIYFIKNPDQITKMGRESHRIAQEKFDAVTANNKLIEYFVGHCSSSNLRSIK